MDMVNQNAQSEEYISHKYICWWIRMRRALHMSMTTEFTMSTELITVDALVMHCDYTTFHELCACPLLYGGQSWTMSLECAEEMRRGTDQNAQSEEMQSCTQAFAHAEPVQLIECEIYADIFM